MCSLHGAARARCNAALDPEIQGRGERPHLALAIGEDGQIFSGVAASGKIDPSSIPSILMERSDAAR
jgi:hypothetical protein